MEIDNRIYVGSIYYGVIFVSFESNSAIFPILSSAIVARTFFFTRIDVR